MYKMKHLTCLNAADPFPMTLGKKIEPAKAVPRSVLLETERREFETKCFDFSEKVPEQEWEPLPDPEYDTYAKSLAREANSTYFESLKGRSTTSSEAIAHQYFTTPKAESVQWTFNKLDCHVAELVPERLSALLVDKLKQMLDSGLIWFRGKSAMRGQRPIGRLLQDAADFYRNQKRRGETNNYRLAYWAPDECFGNLMHVSVAAGKQSASEGRYRIDTEAARETLKEINFDVVSKKHLMAIKLGVPPEVLRSTYKKLSPLSGGIITRVSEKDLDKLAHALEVLCNDYTAPAVSPSKETLKDFARNFFTNVQDKVSLKKARGVLLMNASVKDDRTALNSELINFIPTNRIAGTLMQLKKIHSDIRLPYVCHHVED